MRIGSKLLCALAAALSLLPCGAEAVYKSSTDTGADILDYIENRRRLERENRLNEEQRQLMKDASQIKAHLRQPWEQGQPVPVAFEGDELTYDEQTGEFTAVGKVDIVQMDARRFQSEEATGNTQEQVVRIPDKGHMLQLTPNAPRVTLDGYHTVYNYGSQTGTMEDASGKAGNHYVSGKRMEFYPDKIVIYDGTQTKCGAKNPDYHLSAEKIEIWPGKLLKMYNMTYWLGKTKIGSRKYYEQDLTKADDTLYPRVGYNSENGVYVEQDFRFPFNEHFWGNLHAHIETKQKVRSNAGFAYANRGLLVEGLYGYYSDSDNVWVQKEPGLAVNYRQRIGTSPLNYHLNYEIGHWRANSVASTHQKYEIGLGRDPIIFHGWLLFLHTSYTITKESANRSTVRGMNYHAVLGKDFDQKWAGYFGYHFTKNNAKNSLFRYSLDDYSKKLMTGLSYRMDNLDRFVVGLSYDTENMTLKDVDYYWYRDIHCSQLVLRYRAKRKQWQIGWQFIPW